MMSNIFVGLSVKSSINQPLKNSSLFRHSQCAHRLILTGTDKSGYQEFLIQGVIKEVIRNSELSGTWFVIPFVPFSYKNKFPITFCLFLIFPNDDI